MKLSDASWIWPLLKAVSEGEVLQVDTSSGWLDCQRDVIVNFSHSPATLWRIKPKVHEYRLYKYKENGDVHNVDRNNPKKSGKHLRAHVEDAVKNGVAVWLGPWTPVPQQEE